MTYIPLEIKTGYIYFLKSNLLGGYKIGITTNPQSRFKALGVGTKATLLGYWSLDAYRELEKNLHAEYKAVRVPQSEWFDLDFDQVSDVIQKIASISTQEFLLPEYAQSFVGPQYKIMKSTPYDTTKYNGWNWFGITVILMFVSALVALNF